MHRCIEEKKRQKKLLKTGALKAWHGNCYYYKHRNKMKCGGEGVYDEFEITEKRCDFYGS